MPLGPAAESEEADTVQVLNPVSRDFASLRRSLAPGLLRAVERNWALRQREVRLFEIGHVFRRAPGGPPQERLALAAVITGARRPPHWTEGFRPPDYDLWDLKAIFEEAVRAGGPAGTIEPASSGGWRLVDQAGRERGWARELTVERPPWAASVFGFELEVEARPAAQVTYRPRAVTPPVERDVALLVPEGVTAAQIEQTLKEAGRPLLEEVLVFDEYRKPGVPGRSLAWRLVFRAPDRTLRDEEVDQALASLLGALKERLGVVRREA